MRAAITYVVIVIALWLAVVWKKRDIEQRFSNFATGNAAEQLHRAGNPLYPRLAEVAARQGVDVSAMKNPMRARSGDLYDSEVFTKPPGYYDILVFGDSSLIWSFSPQIIAQVTGKRVGFIGCEAAVPNKGMVRLAERITKTYLKADGLTVFLFTWWTWGMAPDAKQPMPQMQELVDAAQTDAFRQPLALALNSMLGLPRLPIYSELIQPRLSPSAYLEAHKAQSGHSCAFLSWGIGKNAFVLHCGKDNGIEGAKDPIVRDLATTLVSDCKPSDQSANYAANMLEFVHSKMRHKIIALPFTETPLRELSCEAARVSKDVRVLDLPRIAIEKYGITTLEFEVWQHLANTSSILSSVVFGKELQGAF